MAITRHGPVINMDTDQPLNTGQKATRILLHRMLRAHGISHDASGPRQELLDICRRNNVQGFPDVPREAPPARKPAEPVAIPDESRFPRNVIQLRKLCKERGLKWARTDKREDLIAKIQADIAEHGYGKNPA